MDTRRVVSVALGGKFQEQLEEQTVLDWLIGISGISDKTLPLQLSLPKILKTGTLLCKTINKLVPEASISIDESNTIDAQKENLEKYNKACENAGLPPSDFLSLSDTTTLKEIIAHLTSLEKLATQKYQFTGPFLQSRIKSASNTGWVRTAASQSGQRKAFMNHNPAIQTQRRKSDPPAVDPQIQQLLDEEKRKHEEEKKKLEEKEAILRKQIDEEKKHEEEQMKETAAAQKVNMELKKTLETLRNQVRSLIHDRNLLQDRVKITFDTLDKENLQQKRKIDDLKVQLEAMKKEKKTLEERLTEISMGKITFPISPVPSSSSLDHVQPVSTSSSPIPISAPELAIPEEEGLVYGFYGEHKNKIEIKGGTKEKLVEKLYTTSELHSVPEYVSTFLLTYRSFMKPKEVMDLLKNEYNNCIDGVKGITDEDKKEELNKRRMRICNFIKRWVENFYHDFERDTELLEDYDKFVDNIQQRGEILDKSMATLLEKAMKKKLSGEKGEKLIVFNEPPPNPIVPSTITIETVDPLEIARQLTLIEYDMFRSIAPKELLNLSWNSKEKETKSPNVLRMIKRFNQVSAWVSTCIVTESNIKKRQAILKKFIQVAEECYKLSNFNAIFAITSAFSKSPIFRLHKTWEPFRKGTFYDTQEKITNNKGNFKFYKEMLHKCSPPCVPYLGVYLSALTFIEEGNVNLSENGYVNFFKRRLVAEVIKEIQQYQQTPYNLLGAAQIQEFINETRLLDEKEAFKLSLQIEPRETQ